MGKRYWILIFLLGSIICDEHIPRDVDPESVKLHQQIQKESSNPSPVTENKIENVPIKEPVSGDTLDINEQMLDKIVPTKYEDQKEINLGLSSYIHSPSYITFTMLVNSRSIDCYYYKATTTFEVDYQVLKGGDFDIGLSIYDLNNKKVAFQKPSNDGNLKVVVPKEMADTVYSICFDNHESSRATKKVFMMIDVASVETINTPEFAQLNKLDMMHTALSNIYNSLTEMEHLQEKQRSIESIDRSIMERNYEYVTMWCIIQISVMIIVSAVQLVLIRSLFDAKGGIGAIIWQKLHNLTGGRI